MPGLEDNSSHMASLQLPELDGFNTDSAGALALHTTLREQYGIEIPTQIFEGHLWLRVSSQMFNTASDFAALQQAITGLSRS